MDFQFVAEAHVKSGFSYTLQAAATSAGKKAQSDVRGKAANGMHAAAKMLCDQDLTQYARMLELGTECEYVLYGKMIKELRGDNVKTMYAKWATFSWVEDRLTWWVGMARR